MAPQSASMMPEQPRPQRASASPQSVHSGMESGEGKVSGTDSNIDRSTTAKRHRIIHVVGALIAGGAERSAKDLVLAMRREGMPVELAALVPRRDDAGLEWERELEAAGVPVHLGPVARLRPPTVVWLAKLLRAPDVRIVHLHLTYTEIAYYFSRFLHRRKYGVLRKIHNTQLPEGMHDWASRHSDVRFYYACGEAAHKANLGYCKGEQVLIPNGLDFRWEPHSAALRTDRLRELGLDPKETHFVSVGAFRGPSPETAQKAQDVLIAAWKKSGAGAKNARLHFLGGGNLLDAHKALAGNDPSIVFHGIDPNAWKWMAACDVFCLPSRWEGLPLSGVEAVATGVPCIFSDIDPNRELQAEIADYAPPNDVDALATVIQKWIGRRESASAEHVRWQRERWGVGRVMRTFVGIYDRLMPPDGSGPIDPK